MKSGQTAELPDFSWINACVLPLAPGWTCANEPPSARRRNPLLGGAGHRGGRRLGPADGEKCWEEKKTHLEVKAGVKVKNTGGAERACTI